MLKGIMQGLEVILTLPKQAVLNGALT